MSVLACNVTRPRRPYIPCSHEIKASSELILPNLLRSLFASDQRSSRGRRDWTEKDAPLFMVVVFSAIIAAGGVSQRHGGQLVGDGAGAG